MFLHLKKTTIDLFSKDVMHSVVKESILMLTEHYLYFDIILKKLTQCLIFKIVNADFLSD